MEEIKLVTRPLTLEDNWYFEVVEPDKISYTYKVRPAKDFGVAMVCIVTVKLVSVVQHQKVNKTRVFVVVPVFTFL